MQWLEEADILIAEVTTPSLGVGYEIGRFENLGKPILGLFQSSAQKSLSAMIAGNKTITLEEYQTEEDIKKILKNFFGMMK